MVPAGAIDAQYHCSTAAVSQQYLQSTTLYCRMKSPCQEELTAGILRSASAEACGAQAQYSESFHWPKLNVWFLMK